MRWADFDRQRCRSEIRSADRVFTRPETRGPATDDVRSWFERREVSGPRVHPGLAFVRAGWFGQYRAGVRRGYGAARNIGVVDRDSYEARVFGAGGVVDLCRFVLYGFLGELERHP